MTEVLMWVRISEVDRLVNAGWSIAQDQWCHHNHHGVVLMIAPKEQETEETEHAGN